MKILFPIGAFYPSQIGGPCNTIYWHTIQLKKNSITPIIVTTSLGIKELGHKKEEFLDLNCGLTYYGKNNSLNPKTIITSLKQISKVDIIHLNSLFDFLSIFTFILSLLFNDKNIIWSVRGELNSTALTYSKYKKKIILSIYKLFGKKITFHSTSEKETKEIHAMFPKSKIICIPNLMIPSERIGCEIKKQILYIGRIHPIKSLDKIIEGLSMSEEFINSDFVFKIVGLAEERHNYYVDILKSLVISKNLSHKIEFLGKKIGAEKEKLIAESYFSLLLSETENFGNVVIESLNQGTPVYASLGTPWENLNNFKCGIHDSNDPVCISNNISKIINLQADKYFELRINAKKLIDEKYNINNQFELWLNSYNELYNAKK